MAGQVVPELLKTNGAVGLAGAPQEVDHLAEASNLSTAAADLCDQPAHAFPESIGVRQFTDHERGQGLAGIDHKQVTVGGRFGDVEPANLKGRGKGLAVGLGGDDDHRLGGDKAVADEVRYAVTEEVVTIVELDGVIRSFREELRYCRQG